MARRKKPSDSTPMQTRRMRRTVALPVAGELDASTSLLDIEQPTSVSPVPTVENDLSGPSVSTVEFKPIASTSETLDVQIENQTPTEPAVDLVAPPQPGLVQVVARHKKFGKYRLLLNDDSQSRRSEISGSDSESGSIEIRVVDPTVSSESDSNAVQHDEQSDDTSAHFTLSPATSNVATLDSNLSSPAVSIRGRDDDNLTLESDTACSVEHNTEFADTIEGEMSNEMQSGVAMSQEETERLTNDYEVSQPELPPSRDEGNSMSDDDVITVVQIVEEDSAEVYYKINMDSPASKSFHDSPSYPSDPHDGEQIHNFQENFEKLNLSIGTNSPMECGESLDATDVNLSSGSCLLTDIQSVFSRPTNGLIRPDPSITPNSMSDDSNSSRVPSECQQGNSNDSSESSPGNVRRSSRIKTISSLKQKTKGFGLVKTPLKKALITQTKMKLEEMSAESSPSVSTASSTPNSPSFTVPSLDMPVKVKSRWRRSSEMEMIINSPIHSPLASPNMNSRLPTVNEMPQPEDKPTETEIVMSAHESEKVIQDRLNQFVHLDENEYLCERAISREAKKMSCDCFLTKEEVERGELGCGEDCLNRLLMIECNYRCVVGDRCTNRRFQKRENADLKVFYADKKGCGLEAGVDLPAGEFLMEYVGEVLDSDLFYKRAQEYSDDNNLHHYFMSLKGDTVIDATLKGNISRFINHSCEPNAETQKWTVNGELRIGFFSKRDVRKGEEITFDYQFQRFGKEAQRCYCGAGNCRGWIGAGPDSEDEDEEDDEDEDVSTSKTEAESKDPSQKDVSEDSGISALTQDGELAVRVAKKEKKKKEKRRKYPILPKAELAQDADIEDDIDTLSRTGIKNQSHTLTLSRTMVRAKTRKSQASLLRLLREADLPCRRLFLDYRGLRLLAPWCSNTTLDFRLEMLHTLDRLPIPNKTQVQESRLFTFVERWLAEASLSDDSRTPANAFVDDAGLPIDTSAPKTQDGILDNVEKPKVNPIVKQKVCDISKQLLERWSSLKEVFKIPKKERIQQMKEHERQANVERRAADSSGGERHTGRQRGRAERDRERDREREREREREKERDKEKYRERDREKERDKEKDRDRDDRDRRKRRSSPDGRRSIRLEERVLAAIPPVSKEERRRAFAEAAAAAEQSRQQAPPRAAAAPPPAWPQYPGWPTPDAFPQMFPQGMIGAPPGMMPPGMMPPGMMPPGMIGAPSMMGVMGPPAEMSQEWIGPPQGFGPMGYGGPPPFCMPQPNYMGMGGFPLGYMFPGTGPAVPSVPPGFPAPPPALTMPPPGQSDLLPEKTTKVIDERWKNLLPSGWRSAKDEKGRQYYYHVKTRIPQWIPPTPPQPPSDDENSCEEEEESPPQVREAVKGRVVVEGRRGIYSVIKQDPTHNGLIPEQALVSCKLRKRRPGLVIERPISPRSEQDKLASKLQVKRYKETKEKLRRRKEKALEKLRRKRLAVPPSLKIELGSSDEDDEGAADEMLDIDEEVLLAVVSKRKSQVSAPSVAETSAADPEETSRRLKDAFRGSMARVMVQHLNQYRRRDATHARITNTADFKHLARKLTHFVMLKELKHCRSVEELECNDSVKQKAKEFVRKYMAKFGTVYQRPVEEMD